MLDIVAADEGRRRPDTEAFRGILNETVFEDRSTQGLLRTLESEFSASNTYEAMLLPLLNDSRSYYDLFHRRPIVIH